MNTLELSLFIFTSIFLLPLFISTNTIDPGLLPRFILLAVFLILFQLIHAIRICRNGFEKKYTKEIHLLYLFLGGYVLFTILSSVKAVNISESFADTLKVLLFYTYIIVASRIISHSEKNRLAVIKSIVVTSFIVALLGIIEYWGMFKFLDCKVTPASTMGNKNLLSSFLFLSFGFVLFGGVKFFRLWKVISIITFSAILYVFLITQTRAVWVACISSVFISLLISVFLDRLRTIRLLYYNKKTLLILALIGVCLIALHKQSRPKSDAKPEIEDKLASVVDRSCKSNFQRLRLWEKTGKMIQENIFLGVGTGNWKIALPKYGLNDLVWGKDMTTIEVRPYNDFLWVFAEIGIFGFLCFLSIFAAGGYCAIRSIKNVNNRKSRFLSACLLFSLIGFAIISFFDFPKERIEHLVYFGTVLTFLNFLYPLQIKRINVSARVLFMIYCLSILVCIICLWTGFARVNGELRMIKIFNARRQGRWLEVINQTDLINKSLYSIDHTSTPVYWYRGVANFSLNRIEDALGDFKKAHEVHPYHIHVLNNLGSCYEVRGNHSQAEYYYLKALEISPVFDETLINLTAVYYNTKEYKRAYATIMRTNWRLKDPRRESYIKILEEKLKKEE